MANVLETTATTPQTPVTSAISIKSPLLATPSASSLDSTICFSQKSNIPIVPPFIFPFSRVSVKNYVPISLTRADFSGVEYLGNGSNSFVYSAYRGNDRVVIKMLKAQLKNRRIAEQEMISEAGILARLKHPNIVGIIGAGDDPRKFIVLEYLGGGTLSQLIHPEKGTDMMSSIRSLYQSKTTSLLSIANVVFIAKEIAKALIYLHTAFDAEAMVIHRDLKPDNIAFTEDGQLKVIDFGLMACVRKRTYSAEAFEMTGNTGTLVYMAPEVALKKPYTEKADIYSFGVILWQMTAGEVPYNSMKKDEYMTRVVVNGFRLKIKDDLPTLLFDLIEACWDASPSRRPSAEEVVVKLDEIMDVHIRRNRRPSFISRSLFKQSSIKVADESVSLRRNISKTLQPLSHQTSTNTSSSALKL
eukprot:CAMPEP_0170088298 /NCGR_PEP_ID=MMETSP0019_2-20121128/22585_1 /TAXON_ID=98059 /ORGANISM="Dinobryon sp., Strain UTEXLB2267" /LENGTH=414 /DNA_ID=CAMNT_0010306427 /DNA_START=114 /DNA_END=1358 /DNA_ORIENTATION=+